MPTARVTNPGTLKPPGGLRDLAVSACERGDPLDSPVRRRLEHAFDADLGTIRVHRGPASDALCATLRTPALTIGHHIVLASRVPNGAHVDGLRVLAHETCHVLQHETIATIGAVAVGEDVHVGRADGADEVSAHLAAAAVLSGRSAARFVRRRSPERIACDSDGGILVQRWAGWEHWILQVLARYEIALLAPDRRDGGAIQSAAAGQERARLLSELLAYFELFQDGPDSPAVTEDAIREALPGARVIRLRRSGLLLTDGEVCALADYYSSPDAMMEATVDQIAPILQWIRQQAWEQLDQRVPHPIPNRLRLGWFSGQYKGPVMVGAVGRNLADGRTPGQPDDVLDRLASNHTDFWPYAAHSYGTLISRALEEAAKSHVLRREGRPEAADHECVSMMYEAMAHHFLGDMGAAGHYPNKLAAMQVFAQMATEERVNFAEAAALAAMTPARQPNLNAESLYDFSHGAVPVLPGGFHPRMTARERVRALHLDVPPGQTPEGVLVEFDKLVGTLPAEFASNSVHNYFNAEGVTLVDADGRFQVLGDDRLLESGAGASRIAAVVAKSRQMLDEVRSTGTTSMTPEAVLAMLPTGIVGHDGRVMTIQEWNAPGGGMEEACRRLFPRLLRQPYLLISRILNMKVGTVDHQGVPLGGILPSAWFQRLAPWHRFLVTGPPKPGRRRGILALDLRLAVRHALREITHDADLTGIAILATVRHPSCLHFLLDDPPNYQGFVAGVQRLERRRTRSRGNDWSVRLDDLLRGLPREATLAESQGDGRAELARRGRVIAHDALATAFPGLPADVYERLVEVGRKAPAAFYPMVFDCTLHDPIVWRAISEHDPELLHHRRLAPLLGPDPDAAPPIDTATVVAGIRDTLSGRLPDEAGSGTGLLDALIDVARNDVDARAALAVGDLADPAVLRAMTSAHSDQLGPLAHAILVERIDRWLTTDRVVEPDLRRQLIEVARGDWRVAMDVAVGHLRAPRVMRALTDLVPPAPVTGLPMAPVPQPDLASVREIQRMMQGATGPALDPFG